MRRGFLPLVAATAAFMAAVLLLDGDGIWIQGGLGLATAGFLYLLQRTSGVPGRQVLWCVAVATTGEVVLSLGWGLYSYAHAIIPLYVPPGHGVFYTLAAATAMQPRIRALRAPITRGVIVAGSIIALVSLIFFNDVWGLLWWLGALALIVRARNQLLLASCFIYTILLEWAGTAIGNWLWAAEVPFVGLHSANPPAGVGILYILLDLIVVSIVGLRPMAPVADAVPTPE